MIAFTKLGQKGMGRFSNQLFQYAYLRSTAKRLGVKFYCPPWVGDEVFHLNDQDERAQIPEGISRFYEGPKNDCGFNEEAMHIQDGTDVKGFFQSEKYFDNKDDVRSWFTFNEKITRVTERLKHIDFEQSTSMSLRAGEGYDDRREKYPLYPLDYYKKALKLVSHKKHIIIFSDRHDRARKYFSDLGYNNTIFMEDFDTYEQMYLMSQCYDHIMTNSTFAWWGAWLNDYKDKVVVLPEEWFRPGRKDKITAIACQNWIEMKSLHPIFDYHTIWFFFFRLRRKTRVILERIRGIKST